MQRAGDLAQKYMDWAKDQKEKRDRGNENEQAENQDDPMPGPDLVEVRGPWRSNNFKAGIRPDAD